MSRTLKPQDHIAHYRVVGPLGAGGMGEVYRAHDQSLERDVALKVLPPELVTSEERVRRFTLEAKSASSLNHPHIVTIYEIGEDRVRSDGASEPLSGSLHYIAMELVQGKTLAAKIHEEKGELKALLSWLAQAAEGVAKAHAAGIVHRDLKPGNIMVSSDGYAKVLDFGLAKLTERASVDAELSTAPTMTAVEQTSEGAQLGTVGYMAPEQVRGQAVDSRADVFAFGCMLYEAATRRRPFAAESKVETMHRILHDVPAPVEELNPDAPAELRRLIRRCLAKDPNQRVDSMRTLALELREIVEEFEELSASSSGRATNEPMRTGRAPRPRAAIAPFLIGGAVLVVAAAATVALWPRDPRLNPDMHTRILDVPMSAINYPGLSQDGRWIALPARDERGIWGLYFMNALGGDVRPIAVDTTFEADYADISPDGSEVAYSGKVRSGPHSLEEEVRIVPALGGPVRTIARPGRAPHWSPDGRRLGFRVGGGAQFWTVRPDGSDRRQEFADSIKGGLRRGERKSIRSSSAWSPDSRRVAWLRSFEDGAYNEIVIHDLTTGREQQLTHDRKTIDEVVWTRQNEIIFSSNRGGATNLWLVSARGGKPVQLTRGAGSDLGVRVSADGRTLLYLIKQPRSRVSWWNVDTGEGGMVTREDEPFTSFRLSPNGRQILVLVSHPDVLTPTVSLQLMSRDGSDRRVLVPAERDPRGAAWSPDGRRVAWATVDGSNVSSAVLRIVELATGEESAPILVPTHGAVSSVRWWNEDSLLVSDSFGAGFYSISRRGFDRDPDSTFRLPARIPGWRLYNDLRATPRGLYVRPEAGGPAKFVYRPEGTTWAALPERSFIYCWVDSLGFSRLHLPSGRLERIANLPTGIRRDMVFWSNRDGSVVLWQEIRENSKLVLVEKLHR